MNPERFEEWCETVGGHHERSRVTHRCQFPHHEEDLSVYVQDDQVHSVNMSLAGFNHDGSVDDVTVRGERLELELSDDGSVLDGSGTITLNR